MDRLSAYAQRESETESPEDRKKTEEESITNLLEQLRIAKEKKESEPESESETPATQQNGDGSEEAAPETDDASITTGTTAVTKTEDENTEADGDTEKRRGIPKSIKLFEIFHEQVTALVRMQRLTIQDTVGLLVSLTNLAL